MKVPARVPVEPASSTTAQRSSPPPGAPGAGGGAAAHDGAGHRRNGLIGVTRLLRLNAGGTVPRKNAGTARKQPAGGGAGGSGGRLQRRGAPCTQPPAVWRRSRACAKVHSAHRASSNRHLQSGQGCGTLGSGCRRAALDQERRAHFNKPGQGAQARPAHLQGPMWPRACGRAFMGPARPHPRQNCRQGDRTRPDREGALCPALSTWRRRRR